MAPIADWRGLIGSYTYRSPGLRWPHCHNVERVLKAARSGKKICRRIQVRLEPCAGKVVVMEAQVQQDNVPMLMWGETVSDILILTRKGGSRELSGKLAGSTSESFLAHSPMQLKILAHSATTYSGLHCTLNTHIAVIVLFVSTIAYFVMVSNLVQSVVRAEFRTRGRATRSWCHRHARADGLASAGPRSFSLQVEVGRTSLPLVRLIAPLPEDVQVYACLSHRDLRTLPRLHPWTIESTVVAVTAGILSDLNNRRISQSPPPHLATAGWLEPHLEPPPLAWKPSCSAAITHLDQVTVGGGHRALFRNNSGLQLMCLVALNEIQYRPRIGYAAPSDMWPRSN
ncbi:hypothetical protein BC827DRAFT_1158008 [Russula dissimulans]|nr:hypothetical protein BC827DRAFT_1158008 [Russula dissimulans]